MESLWSRGIDSVLFGPHTLQLVAILLFSGFVWIILKELRGNRGAPRRYWQQRQYDKRPTPFPTLRDVADPAQQMSMISKVAFETVPLMNRDEFRVYLVLERVISERRDGYRLMAQTSLGEIIRPKASLGSKDDRDLAFRSINSKRLDFTIFDKSGRLALAIEYQGSGHYHEKSFMRDAVKREALRKAGVPLMEVSAVFNPDELAEQVRQTLPPLAPLRRRQATAINPTQFETRDTQAAE